MVRAYASVVSRSNGTCGGGVVRNSYSHSSIVAIVLLQVASLTGQAVVQVPPHDVKQPMASKYAR